MALITLHDITWGLGDAPLIENATLQIEKGQRICLLGRNGAGKSTLLQILNDEQPADSGDIWRQPGITIAAMDQEVPRQTRGTIFEVVAQGLGPLGTALAEHHRICRESATARSADGARRRDQLQSLLDAEDGWGLSHRVDQVLSRSKLDPDLDFDDISAGMKRRVLFCRAMVKKPDLLLLDEPTNHLDIETITWLEDEILRHAPTLLFVSHDRAFARRLANRILVLDRGRLTAYDCDYAAYLKRRRADAQSDAKQQQRFDRKLSQEEAWIRQGIKARRTRNEGRVRALKKLREAHRARRNALGRVRMQTQTAERTGKLVIEARNICCSYDGTRYIDDFSTVIMRGDKIGLIGPNGVGKTTLLKILLKQYAPDSGSVRHGTRLQVAYFDQLRAQLKEDRSVVQNIGEGNDYIVFNGRKRHVISYLQDFLFAPDRCRTPVHILSGGEKNRLLLARLFTQPANVLVMDEPTNDLDAETLDLLEELMLEYNGTLLLVSHDRTFLNNVVTGTLAFEGQGLIREYPGGYDDWLSQRPSADQATKTTTAKSTKPRPKTDAPRKLGYMAQRELESLPQTIDALETEQQQLFAATSDPDFYKQDRAKISAIQERLKELQAQIDAAYERWQELENR